MSGTWKDRKRWFEKEFNLLFNHLDLPAPSGFKKAQRKRRRNQIKQKMREGNYDCLPKYRKEDSWLY